MTGEPPGRSPSGPSSGPSDDELVGAAVGGDRAALETLLRRHHDRLYAVCRRLTGEDADAADACQEALIAIVRGLPGFDRRASFGTWTYRIATNAALDELRRRRRRPEPGLPEWGDGGGSDGGGGRHVALVATGAAGAAGVRGPNAVTEDLAEDIATRMEVDAAMALLAPEFRAAVVLRDLCTLSYDEIADVLGIPPGTVRSRIARGRAVLAEALERGRRERPGNPAPVAGRPKGRER